MTVAWTSSALFEMTRLLSALLLPEARSVQPGWPEKREVFYPSDLRTILRIFEKHFLKYFSNIYPNILGKQFSNISETCGNFG